MDIVPNIISSSLCPKFEQERTDSKCNNDQITVKWLNSRQMLADIVRNELRHLSNHCQGLLLEQFPFRMAQLFCFAV
jgi:membrane-bound inhibitor of C-type lysozyme